MIKSGPRVIIRAWSQRNWECAGGGNGARSIWETSCWPTRGISHATDSSMTGIYYAPCDRHCDCPLMSTLAASSRMKRLRKLDNCRNETLCYKYIFFLFFVIHREMQWCHRTAKVLWSLLKIKRPWALVCQWCRGLVCIVCATKYSLRRAAMAKGWAWVYLLQEPHCDDSHNTILGDIDGYTWDSGNGFYLVWMVEHESASNMHVQRLITIPRFIILWEVLPWNLQLAVTLNKEVYN